MSKSQPLTEERDASNAESIDWDNRLLTLLSRLNQGGISDEDEDLKENNYQVKGTLVLSKLMCLENSINSKKFKSATKINGFNRHATLHEKRSNLYA